MKLAYIVLAHKYPEQLLRLIDSLANKNAFFYIHIDKKVDISIFRNVLSKAHTKNHEFIKREDGRWGGLGIVNAALNGIYDVLKNMENVDQIILLSGQDYPIKNINYIHEYFHRNSHRSYFDYFPLPSNAWNYQGLDRIERSHCYFMGKSYSHPPYSQPGPLKDKIIQYGMKFIFPEKRLFPINMKPYGGSDWWSMSLEGAHYILKFLKERPDYMRFHKYSASPSEGFFQTILLNSDDEKISANVINNNLRYVDWSKRGKNPAIITASYFDLLIKSDRLFARKFDLNVDANIVDMIDKEILNREGHT
jgi:hypothetical protein